MRVPTRDTFGRSVSPLGSVEQRIQLRSEAFGADLARGLDQTSDAIAVIAQRREQIAQEDAATEAVEAFNAASASIRDTLYGEGGFYSRS
ncbi:MAG: hypothetical protein AAF225_10155, partial [Pseudomonadota bacterium]